MLDDITEVKNDDYTHEGDILNFVEDTSVLSSGAYEVIVRLRQKLEHEEENHVRDGQSNDPYRINVESQISRPFLDFIIVVIFHTVVSQRPSKS